MSIVVNDNIQTNAPKILDNRYSSGGFTPYISVAAANLAIPLPTRAIGLTVNIGGIEYWYKSGLTDLDLVIKSSGSTATLPIVRNVYLVQDASDAVAMGGSMNNVYTTFQTAYNAANAIQVLLGGTNRVVIQVGNTTAISVGDLTLTANWNNNVELIGFSTRTSQVGNIISTNAAGSGFNIGTFLGVNKFRAFNLSIGNITTNATGTTGNSGSVSAVVQNVVIGNIDTSITNVLNVTGNGGAVSFQTIANQLSQNFFISSILTSSQATTSSAGGVTISAQNFSITSITTANNNLGGSINIQSNTSSGGNISTIIQDTRSGFFIVRNSMGNSWTSSQLILSPTPNELKECSVSTLSFTSSVVNLITMRQCIIDNYTSNANVKTKANICNFTTITDLGLSSTLMVCALSQSGILNPTINGISASCRIINCTIEGGSFGIDNPVPVIVDINIDSTYIENAVGANVTLI